LSPWSSVQSPGERFNKEPQALQISSGSNKIWAIDTAADKLWSFKDTLTGTGPELAAPADAFAVVVNPQTGRTADVVYQWSRLSKATEYKLEVAFDSSFYQDVTTQTVASISSTVVVVMGPYSAGPNPANTIEYAPNTTYYWRVKASQPVDSPWSEVRSFTVGSVVAPPEFEPAELMAPAAGTTGVSITPTFMWSPVEGAFNYQVEVSEDDTFVGASTELATSNVFALTTPLEYSTTYYWRVRASTGTPGEEGEWVVSIFTTAAEPVEPEEPEEPETPVTPATPAYIWVIIAIGAVLVISVIVLIVRTRRIP
jgi:hypothetical protein